MGAPAEGGESDRQAPLASKKDRFPEESTPLTLRSSPCPDFGMSSHPQRQPHPQPWTGSGHGACARSREPRPARGGSSPARLTRSRALIGPHVGPLAFKVFPPAHRLVFRNLGPDEGRCAWPHLVRESASHRQRWQGHRSDGEARSFHNQQCCFLGPLQSLAHGHTSCRISSTYRNSAVTSRGSKRLLPLGPNETVTSYIPFKWDGPPRVQGVLLISSRKRARSNKALFGYQGHEMATSRDAEEGFSHTHTALSNHSPAAGDEHKLRCLIVWEGQVARTGNV
jgi:hypothetical protein